MSLGMDGGGVPAVMNVTPTGTANGGNGGGWGGDWGAWIILFLIFGMFGWGGMGGFGFGGFGGMGGGAYPVESILQRSLDTQTIIGKLDGVNQGLCDGFYAQSNAINGLGNTVMQYSYQAEIADGQRQAALMQQLYQMGYNQQDCCCKTQNAIERSNYDAAMRNCETNRNIESVRFTIAQEDCATRNLMQSNTRDLIENQNANARAVLDALTAQRLEAKDERIAAQAAQIQALQLSASQAQQNAAIGAMISASEATILRRTGAECPTPAYVVQPPTPVNFPTNCCGQFAGWGNGGCGSC